MTIKKNTGGYNTGSYNTYGRRDRVVYSGWGDKSKLKLLRIAREDLLKHAFWKHTPYSLQCLDAIIEDYEEKQNDQT